MYIKLVNDVLFIFLFDLFAYIVQQYMHIV